MSRFQRIAEGVAEAYPRKEKLKTVKSVSSGGGSISVWYVDGEYVRTNMDEEFTNFGQHYRFDFIPDDEFWIDEEGEKDEVDFFVEHLLVEHGLMVEGKPYDKAIVEADKAEKVMRRAEGDVEKMKDSKRKIVDPKRAKIRLLKPMIQHI